MIDAMRAALKELEDVLECINQDKIPFDGDDFHETLRNLRQAIAEAEKQELVPEQWMGITDNPYCNDIDCNDPNGRAMRWHNKLLDLRKQVTLQEISDIGREIEKSTNSTKTVAESNFSYGLKEPVAWMFEEYGESSGGMRWFKCLGTEKPQHPESIYRNIIPLYTAPPKREQDNPKLQLDAIERAYFHGKQQGIAESKIKRNWHGKEPVAYVQDGDLHWHDYVLTTYAAEMHGHDLFTEPPKREWVGLTDNEIKKVFEADWNRPNCPEWVVEFSKKIEAKLKEKNT